MTIAPIPAALIAAAAVYVLVGVLLGQIEDGAILAVLAFAVVLIAELFRRGDDV